MTILIIIYIISIIGAILSIRYDQAIFNENSWTIFLVFCPVVNSIICFMEIMDFLPISLSYLNKKLYNLITYKTYKK
jgi:hypothetical protein